MLLLSHVALHITPPSLPATHSPSYEGGARDVTIAPPTSCVYVLGAAACIVREIDIRGDLNFQMFPTSRVPYFPTLNLVSSFNCLSLPLSFVLHR